MEGFDAAQFDEILNLVSLGLHSCVLLALGFRASDDEYQGYKKYRFPREQVFIER